MIDSRPWCQFCRDPKSAKLRRRINSNGSVSVFWYCVKCKVGAQKGEPAISHEAATEILKGHDVTIDDLEIVVDYRTDKHPCVICGNRDTEYNHWMPRMFRDRNEVAPEWGAWNSTGAYLCRRHHMIWHKLVTPYMRNAA